MRISALIVAGLAAAASATTAADQIPGTLKLMTEKSQELEDPAKSITIVNAPLIVVGEGPFPRIIQGLDEITSRARKLTGDPVKVVQEANCNIIYDAFSEFAQAQQAFDHIMIDKATILDRVPLVGQPVASALRDLESVTDTITTTFINACQSRAEDLQVTANSLGNTLDTAIDEYDGLAI